MASKTKEVTVVRTAEKTCIAKEKTVSKTEEVAAVRTAEDERLEDDHHRRANWKRWGPYLSERQWGTVREDYSPDGNW